jgi:hypothetical protein
MNIQPHLEGGTVPDLVRQVYSHLLEEAHAISEKSAGRLRELHEHFPRELAVATSLDLADLAQSQPQIS